MPTGDPAEPATRWAPSLRQGRRDSLVRARALLKAGVPPLARWTGLARALAPRYRGLGTIFMLHSVVPDDYFTPDRSLRCTVSSLDRALGHLRRRGFEFLGLDQAVRRMEAGAGPPFVAFTFDDGFDDNFTHALPVMERHGAPFTVYVTTGMITGDIDAWWLGLAELVLRHDTVAIPGIAGGFSCADRAAKVRTFAAIERQVHLDYDLMQGVRRAVAEAGIDSGALVRKEALTLDRLRNLAAHPLVTIGAHGTRHLNLARMETETARRDMADNRTFLEEVLDKRVRHFAYPFGNAFACGPREAALARELGFATAVTTRHGTVFPAHAAQPHALPRESLLDTDTPDTLACKTMGVYRALHTRLGDPVAGITSGGIVPNLDPAS